MKTTKAYLAGLGMTGIVIGSVVILLVVGTGIVAFDGVPDLWTAKDPLERVTVDDGARADARGEQGRAGLLAAAGRHGLASRRPASERRRGATQRGAARRSGLRRGGAQGHGGAERWTGDRLGGGANVGTGGTGGGGGLPGGSGGPSGGQPALPGGGGGATPGGGGRGGTPGGTPPGGGETPDGGGALLPAPVEDLGGGVTDTLEGVVDETTGRLGGTLDGAVPRGPLR